MNKEKSKKILIFIAIGYWLLVCLIYLVAGEQFHFSVVTSESLSAAASLELKEGITVSQKISLPAENITGIELLLQKSSEDAEGLLNIEVQTRSGEKLGKKSISFSMLESGQYNRILFDKALSAEKNDQWLLQFQIDSENSLFLYFGNTVSSGRFDIPQQLPEDSLLVINGQIGLGMLCLKVNGLKTLNFYRTYWFIVTAIFVISFCLCMIWWKQILSGQSNPLFVFCTMCTRYSFLIKQLVMRDFKAKYKRSVLGMAWSFLNPLMTMSVQYFIFSTVFKSDIPNYPVYLLTGIVFMSFFNEAVSLGMTSITGNASLIKKVYMPKYIYPVSRIISSMINFVLAILPLFLVMLITGSPFRPSILLLPFDFICLVGFVTGMVLLTTTGMTFFQDTQFLWSVASMMWMYVTPIFYPESIIPSRFLPIYRMNPMYQYVTFARTCIIDGISPEPISYLWCILSSLFVFLLGIFVFKKNQDKFVLYL